MKIFYTDIVLYNKVKDAGLLARFINPEPIKVSDIEEILKNYLNHIRQTAEFVVIGNQTLRLPLNSISNVVHFYQNGAHILEHMFSVAHTLNDHNLCDNIPPDLRRLKRHDYNIEEELEKIKPESYVELSQIIEEFCKTVIERHLAEPISVTGVWDLFNLADLTHSTIRNIMLSRDLHPKPVPFLDFLINHIRTHKELYI